MKRFSRFMITALLMVLILAGCNPESDVKADGRGILSIVVDDVAARGLDPVNMDTAYYQVKVSNSEKNFNEMKTFMAYANDMNMSVATGKTEVEVLALNKDKQIIGSGNASVDVLFNQTTECNVTISEKSGNGNLKFEVKTTYDCEMSAKVHAPNSETPVTVELVELNDVFSGSTSLANGYYQFELVDGNGKTLTAPETVRIVAGYDAVYNITIDDSGMIKMTLKNMITPTPSITFSGVAAYYVPGDTFNITAKVEGMTAPAYKWYFDGVSIENSNFASVTGTLPPEGITVGKHVITCVATEGDTIWSESFEAMLYSKSERPRELEIPAGTLEISMIGDVLVPTALDLEYMIDGESFGHLNCDDANNVIHVQAGNLSCAISGAEGYSYHLETIADPDRTVILVVIEKNIVDPAFINFTFNQKFILADNTSRALGLRADRTQFPSEENYDPRVGYLCLNNRVKERTIMVEPDDYLYVSNRGWRAPEVYRGTMNPRSIHLTSGETVDVEIGSEPFATVNAVVPDLPAEIRRVDFRYQDGRYINRPTRISDGAYQLATYTRNGEKLIAFVDGQSFAYYETDILNLVEGENDVTFKKVEPPCIVNTDYDVTQGEEIYFECTVNAVLPGEFVLNVGVDSCTRISMGDVDQQTSMIVNETGKLRVIPLFLDGYDVTVTERSEKIDGHRVFDIVLDLPADKCAPVEIKYDFTYDQAQHHNIYPCVRKMNSNDSYFVNLRNGRSSINMPLGEYRGDCGSGWWGRVDDPVEDLFVKENTFSVVTGAANSITIGARPWF